MTILHKFLISFGFLFLLLQLLFTIPEQLEIADLPVAKLVTQSGSQIPEQVMIGVHVFERKDNKEDLELEADTAEAFSASESWKLKNVRTVLYGEEVKYNVSSNEAEVNTETMDIKILGNIHMKTDNDYQFQTEFLSYTSKNRELDSPSRTKFITPADKNGSRLQLEADKIVANVNENQVNAIGNVLATKKEKKSEVIIRSQEAVFHLDTQYSQFMNQVKINYHTSLLEGPLASLKYDEQQKTLTDLEVTGGATLKDQNRLAVAQSMSIDFVKDLFHLKGSPRVIQGSDELIGSEILLLNGGKQIQVKGAKAQIEDLIGK